VALIEHQFGIHVGEYTNCMACCQF
jgi:hypothetical protein